MQSLRPGFWLGIDVGSRRSKLCSFCAVTSDGAGEVTVLFERGPARDPYPSRNSRDGLLDPDRPPSYLRETIEQTVDAVLEGSALVARAAVAARSGTPVTIALDAPVALATEGRARLTERASTQPFYTPDRQTFAHLLVTQGDPYLRINLFWKCIGFALYRALDRRFPIGLEKHAATVPEPAARTASPLGGERQPAGAGLRETFPSDVYKRANGTVGVLARVPGTVLGLLVASGTPWQGAGERRTAPSAATIARLRTWRDEARTRPGDPGPIDALCRRPGATGDLWDAFACAFAAGCADHGGGVLHGEAAPGDPDGDRLAAEGSILTVATKPCREDRAEEVVPAAAGPRTRGHFRA